MAISKLRLVVDSKERDDLSHPVHSDNCVLQPDGSCLKEYPAYIQRDYRCVLTEGLQVCLILPTYRRITGMSCHPAYIQRDYRCVHTEELWACLFTLPTYRGITGVYIQRDYRYVMSSCLHTEGLQVCTYRGITGMSYHPTYLQRDYRYIILPTYRGITGMSCHPAYIQRDYRCVHTEGLQVCLIILPTYRGITGMSSCLHTEGLQVCPVILLTYRGITGVYIQKDYRYLIILLTYRGITGMYIQRDYRYVLPTYRGITGMSCPPTYLPTEGLRVCLVILPAYRGITNMSCKPAYNIVYYTGGFHGMLHLKWYVSCLHTEGLQVCFTSVHVDAVSLLKKWQLSTYVDEKQTKSKTHTHTHTPHLPTSPPPPHNHPPPPKKMSLTCMDNVKNVLIPEIIMQMHGWSVLIWCLCPFFFFFLINEWCPWSHSFL